MYEIIASGYDELHRQEQMNKLRIIRENLALQGSERILDVGCGPCWSRIFFNNVIGIDPVPYNEHILCASAESIPFADETFDLILCVTAAHHFEIDRALTEMMRVTTKETLLVITVLKKARSYSNICQHLQTSLRVLSTIDEGHDIIFFLDKNSTLVNHLLVSTIQ